MKFKDFKCIQAALGFGIISLKTEMQLGHWYKKQESCMTALTTQNEGFICAPLNAHSAAFSIETEEPIGNSWYNNLTECVNALTKAHNDMACIVNNDGVSPFNRDGTQITPKTYKNVNACLPGIRALIEGLICKSTSEGYKPISIANGRILGSSAFSSKDLCSKAIKKSVNNYLCTAEPGGTSITSSSKGSKLGNGTYNKLDSCIASLEKSNSGVICSANDGGSSLFRMSDGEKLGTGTYKNSTNCWKAVSSIREGIVCAPIQGWVYPVNITTNSPLNSAFKTLGNCLESH